MYMRFRCKLYHNILNIVFSVSYSLLTIIYLVKFCRLEAWWTAAPILILNYVIIKCLEIISNRSVTNYSASIVGACCDCLNE